MAGALTTATYKLNAVAETPLTVVDGAVSQAVDLVATHGANFPHHSTDRKTVLLSRLFIDAVDAGGVHKTHQVFFGRDLHKLLHFTVSPLATGWQIDGDTTIGTFLTISTELRAGFWMPQRHTGTAFAAATLTSTDLGDLFNPGVDFHIGLKLTYIDGATTKYKYANVPLPSTFIDRWHVEDFATPTGSIKAHFVSGLVTGTATAIQSKYCSFEAISTDVMSSRALDFFGLTIADVDAGSEISITPFAYLGAVLSAPTASAPTSIGYFNDAGATNPTMWTKAQTVSSANTMTITSTVSDQYNTETFTEGDYGWLGEYNSGITTDTSVNITIGTT